MDAVYWLVPAAAAAAFTYYNIPLLETGRPTIGANQYGIFLQAFGLIRWRAIERIDLVQIAERAMTVHELPWRMSHNNMVRVNLEPFDQPPDQIHRTFLRMWRYYRS